MTYIGSLQGGTGGSASVGSVSYTPGSGLSGLASGVNTDAMVQGLMGAAQVPLIQLLQQRQVLQWQEIRYQQVNASLTDLQNQVQNMQLQSTFLANQTTSSDASVVTASASPVTPQGTYSVTVGQLAQGATLSSAAAIPTTDASYPSDTPLSSIADGATGGTYANGVTLTINGQSFSFSGTNTLQDVLNQINSNPSVGVTAFFDTNSDRFVFQTTATGGAAKVNVDAATAQFFSDAFDVQNAQKSAGLTGATNLSNGLSTAATIYINGQKMSLSGTLSNMVQTINGYSATTGVTAQISSSGSNITLMPTSTDSGGTSEQLLSLISVSDPSGVFGFPGYSGAQAQQVAQDATFTVNGVDEVSATNQPTFNGLQLNLQGTSSSPVNISVTPDVSSVVKSIENFVQQYNQTLQLMQGLYNEKRDYSYQPLTQQQASQMTQTQIDQWNQKAQTGVLENDPTLGGAMNTLENDIQQIVSGQPSGYNSLQAIGISPIDPLTGPASGAIAPGVTTTGWNTYGLLQVDPTQLQNAIQSNPQAVMRLFTNNPQLPGATSGVGTGIGVQLYNDLESQIQQLTAQAGANPNVSSEIQTTTASGATITGAGLMTYTLIDPNADFSSLFGTDSVDTSYLGQQISGMDSQATSMQQQLNQLQQRYQNEFSQMEQALAQINNQSGGLMAMLGGGSSGSSASGG
ncbi:MAG: flagellar filament capping protein FliD [Alicyclobacillus sp.]|nr:flagellar filament capping protein FliD [Alicyclobacillus sp.]